MAKRPIDISEVWQNLIEPWFHEFIDYDPKQQRRYFVSNLVQRTLAHLVGRGRTKSIPIRATEAGALKVATVGTGLEDYDYTEHTADDDDPITVEATTIWSGFDIVIIKETASIRLTPDGTRWGEWFTINPGEALSKDLVVHTLEIKNASAGKDHEARIWGYY